MQIEELRRYLHAAHTEGHGESPASLSQGDVSSDSVSPDSVSSGDVSQGNDALLPEDQAWLRSLGVSRQFAWRANLRRIAEAGVPLDLLASLCDQFHAVAPSLADADMAWNNLERFLASARSPLSTAALFERDPEALPSLLQLLSTSQYVSDVLVQDQECYDLVRMTEGRPVARDLLVEELVSELDQVETTADAMALLRQNKRRETIRIAYGDIIRGQVVSTVARQISFLADALVEAALAFGMRQSVRKFGVPRDRQGEWSRYCVLALGKLGGVELNYSSDIDLIFFYDGDGQTDGERSISNREFFERLSRDLVKLLGESTDRGIAYRVDLRLRPDGARGAVCLNREQMLAYYDIKGRTWERQAYIKARPIAGDRALGTELLARLGPWIYRRYLSMADITGIKSLKRRIEQKNGSQGTGPRDVKTGHGGIRDIEFVIQFLQLLNGGALPEVRGGNTFDALLKLEQAGCLTPQEHQLLADNYAMLRKLEHRLQIMYDVQTHTLPTKDSELGKLAVRMGYVSTPHRTALEALQIDYRMRTEVNRKMLDHLLHDAFADEDDQPPEVDLVNDPNPSDERIAEVLGRYPFEDLPAAYANLMALADEKIRFLSTRRARHFLAGIAPRLLQAIARTPEPDTTLVNLSRVSDSLGGKAALWELFSANPPTLNLYVTLCAACPYLANVLTSNPGMIDELMDSLLVSKLPTAEMLESTLADLARGAEDLDPILHSFKNSQHLRVGVRDILGRDDISATHQALADVAETCVRRIADHEREAVQAKFGTPRIVPPMIDEEPDIRFADRAGEACELVILALGKLGGREPNYHSDLDLIFLYETDGNTDPPKRGGGGTTNGHYFSQLGQKIVQTANRLGPFGRLFDVDARLRPTGKSGPLAVSIAAFERYYAEGRAQLWERQALCKARVVYGSPRVAEMVMQSVNQAAYGPPWQPQHAGEIRDMRRRLEEDTTPRNLKRSRGGTVDTEFLVQMLQLRHGGEHPSLRVPGTLAALNALQSAGLLSPDDAEFFRESYRFQRSIEARIRLMNSVGRHELPTDERELEKLAFLLSHPHLASLRQRAMEVFEQNRQRFDRLFDQAAHP